MTLEELQEFARRQGWPDYRGRQLAEWVYHHAAQDFADMTPLPAAVRRRLQETAALGTSQVQALQQAPDGTAKFLLALPGGDAVETVFIPHSYGGSVCVSSQVGCAMQCAFCASGIGGLVRSLSAGEMVEEVLAVRRWLKGATDAELPRPVGTGGLRVTHVVVMGSGEPLQNYDNLLRFLRIAEAPWGLGIGFRRITVSTAGWVPGIRRLAEEDLPITLAVSLHAPDDGLRSQLMPINRRFPLDQLIPACRQYAQSSGRRLTFEYVLIRDVNDRPEHARQLVQLIRGILGHVNLIPLNPVAEHPWQRPDPGAVERFARIVAGAGIPVTVRREMGTSIDAACGQLRRRVLQAAPETAMMAREPQTGGLWVSPQGLGEARLDYADRLPHGHREIPADQ